MKICTVVKQAEVQSSFVTNDAPTMRAEYTTNSAGTAVEKPDTKDVGWRGTVVLIKLFNGRMYRLSSN